MKDSYHFIFLTLVDSLPFFFVHFYRGLIGAVLPTTGEDNCKNKRNKCCLSLKTDLGCPPQLDGKTPLLMTPHTEKSSWNSVINCLPVENFPSTRRCYCTGEKLSTILPQYGFCSLQYQPVRQNILMGTTGSWLLCTKLTTLWSYLGPIPQEENHALTCNLSLRP